MVVLIFGAMTLTPPPDVDLSFHVDVIEKETEGVLDDSDAFHVALAQYFAKVVTRNTAGVETVVLLLRITLLASKRRYRREG